VCLGLGTANAAERGDTSGAGAKHQTASDENHSDKTSKKRSLKSSAARSHTKHRSSATAGRKATKRTKATAKVSENRRDVAAENEVNAIADEANNSVELPSHEDENANEIENQQAIDDASTNLMGTDNQNEVQDDSIAQGASPPNNWDN